MRARSALPEIVEPGRRQLGVPHRVLDRPVPKPILNSAGVVAVVGELEAAGMPEHVDVDREAD